MHSIVARYTYDDKEYSVVVTGHGKELNGTAPDIVAARKLADGLVKKIAAAPPSETVVVHLLDNSAVAFTRAYLAATMFGHQVDRETDAPQDDAQSTSAGGAITEEKATDETDNNTEEDPGASSS